MPETAPKAAYSREEVRRMLAVSERQLRGWERQCLIPETETFALPDLIALRTLVKLRKDRVAPATIRAAMAAVRNRLREVNDPLRELKVISDGKRIRVEMPSGGQMEPISGQLLFNFDKAELRRLLSFPRGDGGAARESKRNKQAAESWFRQGLQCEKNGATNEAITAYESAIAVDPGSAGALVNLGTIYFNARQYAKAEKCYKQALEADAEYALAHFNIANLYDERGDYERALDHYRKAIDLQPGYADAHYNLALLFQGGGQVMEAVRHWKSYLKLDPNSSWSAIARRELEKLRRSVVRQSRPANRPSGTSPLD
ncbi:MAG TPA: tetratricopeptide repeat protein [Bryobacteraceae bacterium]|nr:tetratricopeptide repeat protein [Bryobacteraceae bacterium]